MHLPDCVMCTSFQSLFGMGADHPSVSSAQRTALCHSQDQEDGWTGSLESLRRQKRQFAYSPRLDRPSPACSARRPIEPAPILDARCLLKLQDLVRAATKSIDD